MCPVGRARAVADVVAPAREVGVMTQRSKDSNQLVIDYLFLRKTVGWIGTLLPIVLIAGNALFFTTSLPDSMSSYYYTHMRDVFVGALCALGVFLLSYAGYDEWDRWITNIAGLGAIGVALCATKPTVCGAHARSCAAPAVRTMTSAQNIVGTIHLVFAAAAFLALGVMAVRFARLPRSDEARPPGFLCWFRSAFGVPQPGQPDTRTRADKRSAVIFRSCGLGIVACVVFGVLSNFLPQSIKNDVPVLFVLEALAVFAFGLSWFVKGQTLVPTVARLAARVRLGGTGPQPPAVDAQTLA
jgi:hypothetical protein